MGKSTVGVVDMLRAEGFQVSPSYVAWALRERHIAPPDNRIGLAYSWAEGDIERLRSFLRRRDRAPKGMANA
jgi:hypothetical protein